MEGATNLVVVVVDFFHGITVTTFFVVVLRFVVVIIGRGTTGCFCIILVVVVDVVVEVVVDVVVEVVVDEVSGAVDVTDVEEAAGFEDACLRLRSTPSAGIKVTIFGEVVSAA